MDAVSSASYTTIDGTAIGRLRAVADMLNTIAPSETKAMVEKFYEDAGMMPDNVNISDLVVRPSKEA